MKPLNPAAIVLQSEVGLAKFKADPIANFRFSSYAQRRFVQSFHKYREVYLRAGNQAGKTHVAAHFFVAIMRGITSLCGDIVGIQGVIEKAPRVPLPILGTPVSGVVLAQGREMSKESVVKAVRLAIGDHPHHVEKNNNVIAAIWVKPDRSRSEIHTEWSCIRFFVEDGQSTEGMRLDFVWADEPPKWKMWEGLRMRSRANRQFMRGITATPIDKATWKPLRMDYKPIENKSEGKDGKIEIRLSVYDNKMLSEDHLRQLEFDARGPLKDAKLLGDYCDTTGSNPFDAAGLKKWLERCTDPIATAQYFTRSGRMLEYEIWQEPRPEEEYLIVADPSGGIEDEAHEHDPCEVIVVARRQRAVVVRYNGYLRAFELGRLSVHLARKYNNGLVAFERNSGYGEAFFEGAEKEGYGEFYIEHHMDSRTMSLSERIGWNTNATSRGTIISACQKAIENDTLLVWSAAAVDSLGDVTVKRDGIRIEAGANAHDEDMIVFGFAVHHLDEYPVYWAPPSLNATQTLVKAGLVRPERRETGDQEYADW